MKSLILIAVSAATLAAEPYKVTVHMQDQAGVPFQVRNVATAIASQIYEPVGIAFDWRLGRSGRRVPNDIVIEFRSFTPPTLLPGALAYAFPFEGTHVVVFYDRLKDHAGPAQVLGHVIAHEIGHVLQGVMHHANSGVMKASWTLSEYGMMHHKVLEFTPFDVVLIRQGLARRSEE